ncbi:MAG TPA: hypothetical protein VIG50_02590 [Vicinamibacteria bacterium]
MNRAAALALALTALVASAAAGARDTGAMGGLTELYDWPGDTANAVWNGSFEDVDAAGRAQRWDVRLAEHFFPTTAHARSGRRSLQLSASHRAPFYPSACQDLTVPPGWYRLRGWIKPVRAGASAAGSGGRIGLYAGSAALGATPVVAGTADWTRVEREKVLVPDGAPVTQCLEAYAKPDGDLFFDDVELNRLAPPMVDAFVLYPNYRGMLLASGPQEVRVSLRAPADAPVPARLTLTPEGGADALVTVHADASAQRRAVALDASRLPPGAYTLRVEALDARTRAVRFQYPPHRIVKLAPGAERSWHVYVAPDGVLVRGGQRQLVLGIYDTGGYSEDPLAYEERLSAIAQAPFNMYVNYRIGRASTAALDALMSALKRKGMAYLHTVNFWYADDEQWPLLPPCGGRSAAAAGEEAYTACRARELGDNPALAGWYTADERPAEVAPRVFRQYRTLRAHDDGVTFIAQNAPHELVWYRDVADVIGVDPYPIFNIPEGAPSPLEQVTEWVDLAQAAVERSRPVWAVIQFFQFGGNGHWPTYDELRSMSYMALVAGARGLFYWSYGAGALSHVADDRLREEYWQRLVRVTREIKSLEPALLGPDDPTLLAAPPAGRLRALARRGPDGALLVVVNNGPQPARATLRLGRAMGAAEVVGEGRRVALAGGTELADDFAPYAAHVYRFAAEAAR